MSINERKISSSHTLSPDPTYDDGEMKAIFFLEIRVRFGEIILGQISTSFWLFLFTLLRKEILAEIGNEFDQCNSS